MYTELAHEPQRAEREERRAFEGCYRVAERAEAEEEEEGNGGIADEEE